MHPTIAFVRLNSYLVVLALLCPTFSRAADREKHAGLEIMFGNLHSHSNLSDDTKNVPAAERRKMTPLFAFTHAQAKGLDFLAVSDHQKATDSSGRLFMTPDEYKTKLFDVAMKYNRDHPGELVAIPAIEWGNTATGNHVNVFGAEQLPPDTIKDKDYDDLFQWAASAAKFTQFNHPASWKQERERDKSVGNFGEALYPDLSSFARAVGGVTATCAVLNSIVGGHLSGADKHSERKVHRDLNAKFLAEWKRFLNLGFHVSPSTDQDTHWLNFGTVTAARTAVWSQSGSYDHLMAGFRARRVYATEDDELTVAYQVASDTGTYWMGDTAGLSQEEADVELIVKIWQGKGVDGDATDEGPYEVDIIVDPDGVGGQQASKLGATATFQSGVERRLPLSVRRGSYVYLEVRETNGKDNPLGEGDDEIINATGAHGKDQKRDDLNDSAVTSPVWFGAPAVTPAPPLVGTTTAPENQCPARPGAFVWTVNSGSKVYHDKNCWSVQSIGMCNRRYGDTSPEGRSKHNCHP